MGMESMPRPLRATGERLGVRRRGSASASAGFPLRLASCSLASGLQAPGFGVGWLRLAGFLLGFRFDFGLISAGFWFDFRLALLWI